MPEVIIMQNQKELCRKSFEPPCFLAHLIGSLAQPCAGRGYCGKCRVRAHGKLSRPTAQERAKLTARELSDGVRLACQAMALGDVRIFLPNEPNTRKANAADVVSVSPLGSEYGFALDLGTTTVSAALYHLPTGKCCGRKNIPNPQSPYGADVLSRLQYAVQGSADALSTCVRHALYDLCASLLMEQRLAPNDVDAAVLVGNTAMLYLLYGVSPATIAAAPFTCDTKFGAFYPADFLPVRRGTKVYVPRCISAFLGADTTAAILGCDLTRSGARMLCDLGTNGEMVLYTGDALYGCSCAAGPAFEGVGLSCGMCAVDGAVHTAMLSGGHIVYRTCADAPPKGLCGSGVVDLLACLLRLGVLQEDGRLTNSDRYYLEDTPVYLSQQDVRQIQLAKSAVRSGSEILLRHADADVQALSLAGTFGSALHAGSAARIGLFPPALHGRISACGNAAGTGAAMLLLDRGRLEESERLAQRVQTIQLADLPEFQELLMRYTAFESSKEKSQWT